jgi:hypothetical protein
MTKEYDLEYGHDPLETIINKVTNSKLEIVLLPYGNSCTITNIKSFTSLPQRAGDRGTIRALIELEGAAARDVTISWYRNAPRMTQSVLFSARSIGGSALFPETLGTFFVGDYWFSIKDWVPGEAFLDVVVRAFESTKEEEWEEIYSLTRRILDTIKLHMYASQSLTSSDLPVDFSHEFMTWLEYLCIYRDYTFPVHYLEVIRSYFAEQTSAMYQGLSGTHIHGDLNPGNIIISSTNGENEVKFVDYKYELTKDWTKDIGKFLVTLATDLGYPNGFANIEATKRLFSAITDWSSDYAKERGEEDSWERRLLFFLVRQMVTTSVWGIRIYERVPHLLEKEQYLEKSHKMLERACKLTKCKTLEDGVKLLFDPYLS